MDRLDELAVFIAVLDTGSLAAAARKLRRSPPAVTRALSTLEARAGARLIERTTRRLAPTEAGRRLAEHARTVLASYDDALGNLPDAPPSGLLRVTAPLVFGRIHVTPVVATFLDTHPAVRIEFLLSDRNLDLIEEGVDVAVRIGHLAGSGSVVRRVGEVRRVLIASPDYLARNGPPQDPADLAGHHVVFTTGRSTLLEWRFQRAGREQAVRLRPRLVVNEIESMLWAVRAGYGIGRALSYQVAEDLEAGRLVRLLPGFEPPALPVHLVVPSAQHMAPKVRAFLDHAARCLQRLDLIRPEQQVPVEG
ncbi:MAG TPA: LysR family transcriptional regulator [Azospirillaceae bacterium]|nr:LysR family transcriptional regulator [Azospirillaceae bacterium]